MCQINMNLISKTAIVLATLFSCALIAYAADEEKKIDLSSSEKDFSSIILNDTRNSTDSVDIYNIEESQSAFQFRSKKSPVGYYGMMYSEPERVRGLQEEDELKVGIGINIEF